MNWGLNKAFILLEMFFFFRNFLHKKWCIFKNDILRFFISVVTEIIMIFLLFLFLIIIFFLGSVSLCIFLSYYFENYVIGFGIVTFLYFIFFIFMFFLCKQVTRSFIQRIISKSIDILGENKKY
ncbi:hypothetical protein [Blattabacterium cuenoti]|uniref:hypothetical protein n=1 Tax=Blattabacterium cuenoti TaxID=1653831 RepID=UPI001EEB7086|nr:hypothetical protein [Blattabacterium cuenoti]